MNTMKNHFFYKTIAPLRTKDENGDVDYVQKQEVEASFDINMVYRTQEVEKGKLMLILKDFHPITQTIEIPLSNKSGLVTGGRRTEVRDVHMYSEIELNEEDSKRFREMFEIK